MATGGDYVNAALTELGVIGAGETPENYQSALGLQMLNSYIDMMGARGFNTFSLTRTTWTIVSGTASYTVGAGGTVNIARPVFIDHVNFIDTSMGTPYQEFPLPPLLTDDAYAAIPQKDLENEYPLQVWYNPTYTVAAPYGTLVFWPEPTSSTLLGVLYAPTAISQITSLATTIAYPPGYRMMFEKNLALFLAPAFQVTPSPLTVLQARNALNIIERANIRLMDQGYPQGALVQGETGAGLYNDRSDTP